MNLVLSENIICFLLLVVSLFLSPINFFYSLSDYTFVGFPLFSVIFLLNPPSFQLYVVIFVFLSFQLHFLLMFFWLISVLLLPKYL